MRTLCPSLFCSVRESTVWCPSDDRVAAGDGRRNVLRKGLRPRRLQPRFLDKKVWSVEDFPMQDFQKNFYLYLPFIYIF